MLHCNLGCQNTTFNARKHELTLLNQRASDADVLNSFRDSVDPRSADPWMLNFIRMGSLGVVLGDTLFVHGGLYDRAIGVVPGREGRIEDVREWITILNSW